MPPCAIWEDAALAPEQKSPRSTNNTSTPFRARSRNVPIPLIPPPTIKTETCGFSLSCAKISSRFIVFHTVVYSADRFRKPARSYNSTKSALQLRKLFQSSTFFLRVALHPGLKFRLPSQSQADPAKPACDPPEHCSLL